MIIKDAKLPGETLEISRKPEVIDDLVELTIRGCDVADILITASHAIKLGEYLIDLGTSIESEK